MAYFADLSEYDYYWWGEELKAANVGWLESSHPFQTGVVPNHLIATLKSLCDQPVLIMRGIHICDFCRGPSGCGTGEIRVIGCDSKVYAAPTLIHHYVTDHNYLPPKEFLLALEARSIDDHLAEMKKWDEYEPEVESAN